MDGGKSDIPENIKRFRTIINGVKRNILNETETRKSNTDIQDANVLNGIVKRIHEFGSILNMILDNIENPTTEKIRNHFMENNFDFSNLSSEDMNLCRHYVYVDIRTLPFDLNPGHSNSVVGKMSY